MIKAIIGILLGAVLTAVFMAVVHKLYRDGVDAGIIKENTRKGTNDE